MNHKSEEILKQLNSQQDFAIGNDVVFLPDFEQSFNDLFKKKVYTSLEIKYCELFTPSTLRYASTWAAKEAVYKAVKQLDQAALPFNKIEIIREKISGRPHVNLPHYLNKFDISLSITHDGDYIWAAALVRI